MINHAGKKFNYHSLSNGFTLIELLVVMVIIGVLTSFAALSLKSISQVDELTTWTGTLKKNIEYAQDLSVLRRAHYGIIFANKKIKFVQYIDSEWQTSNDPLLSVLDYPKKSLATLYLEGNKILSDDDKVRVLISENSSITQFELHLTKAKNTYVLIVEPTGEIVANKR